ncbi:SLOG family protein [Streptomyces rochei]|uniref:SLOG family protein n=1 Tax=Streptomyces rochei TaxID=1928 RepID=UPI0036FC6325
MAYQALQAPPLRLDRGGTAVRVIVTGSRAWPDPVRVAHELTQLYLQHGPFTLIHGACSTGADAAAHHWYETAGLDLGCIETKYPAAWDEFGKRAGPIRNKQMIEEASADLVLAFFFADSRGTRHTVDLARAAGIEIKEFRA